VVTWNINNVDLPAHEGFFSSYISGGDGLAVAVITGNMEM